jgi:hypothetical protein
MGRKPNAVEMLKLKFKASSMKEGQILKPDFGKGDPKGWMDRVSDAFVKSTKAKNKEAAYNMALKRYQSVDTRPLPQKQIENIYRDLAKDSRGREIILRDIGEIEKREMFTTMGNQMRQDILSKLRGLSYKPNPFKNKPTGKKDPNWDPDPTGMAQGGIAGQLHMNEGGRVGLQRGGGLPAVDPRMQNTYAENIAANEAQRVINQVGRQNISNKGNQRALSLAAPVATFFAGATPYKNLSALRTEAMDKSLFDIIEKKGTPEGVIGYSDYDTSQTAGSEFPALNQMLKNLAAGKMSAADFANATTLGRLTYKIDPDTGKVSFGSNKYDFRPEMADQGGLFGYLAKKANERGININPNVTMPTTQQSDLQKFTTALNAAHELDNIRGLDYQRSFDDYRYNTGNYNMMGSEDNDAIIAGTARPFFSAGPDTSRMVSNFQSHFNKPYGYALASGGLAKILGV